MIWRTWYDDWYYINEVILWVAFWDHRLLSGVNIQDLVDDLVCKVRDKTSFDRSMAFSVPSGEGYWYWLRLKGE